MTEQKLCVKKGWGNLSLFYPINAIVMKRHFYSVTLVFLLLFAGCRTVVLPVKTVLEEEGQLFVYAEPFPPESERLRFSLSAVLAVREDNQQYPLVLARSEMTPDTMAGQHLLASGALPPGRYAGLAFTAKDAALKGEAGYSHLLTETTPVRNDFPFEIKRKKALTIALTLKPSRALQDGFRFTPSFSLALPPPPLPALTGYVSNRGGNTITVFDKKSGRVGGVIIAGQAPAGLAIDQTRRQVYVALADEDAIAVIDMQAGEIINKVALQGRDEPQELALTRDGRTLLALNSGSDTVSFIEPLALVERSRVKVGDNPISLTVDRAGQRAYVCNSFSNSISVIDIPNRALITTVPTEPAPLRGEFNRSGDRLFIAFESSPYLAVFDAASLSMVKRAYVGPAISALKLDTRTDMLYVARKNSATVEGLDPFSLLPVDYLIAGDTVTHMAIDKDEGNFFFIVPEKNRVAAFNPASKAVVFELDTGMAPYRLTLMGEK